MPALEALIYGVRELVNSAGVALLRRSRLKVVGATLTDDDASDSTVMTINALSADDRVKFDGLQKQGASIAIAALQIDWALGGTFYKTLATGASAFTFANVGDGNLILVRVVGVGGTTVTWPAGIVWPGGTVPTQSAPGADLYTFVKINGIIHGTQAVGMA